MTEREEHFVSPVAEINGVRGGADHICWGITLGSGTVKRCEMVLGEAF